MKKEELIEGIVEYLRPSDHWRRLLAALQDPDPQRTHIHAYVDTCLHPNSLEEIIKGYFQLMGWPSTRRIDHMSPKSGMGSLHGIEPQGKPHLDFQWFYHPQVTLRPTQGGEGGSNLLVWNRWYIDNFYSDFEFQKTGPAEEREIREYFNSNHWKGGLELAIHPDTTHLHINVEMSVHPDKVGEFAEQALQARGWKIWYVCPNVYLVKGKYRGKLVFMGKEPEAVYDLGWQFNPDVVIGPTTKEWIFPDHVGYDIWTRAMLEEVMSHPYVELEPDEIQRVLDTVRPTPGK
jgi:hypothetical protein